ncbi:MAG: ATP synthase subunit C [Planctomycetota bacterium]|jgi:V/A-type H+-transporting ATPase subunit K
MNKAERKLKSQILQSVIGVLTVMAIVGTLFCTTVYANEASHEEESAKSETSEKTAVELETRADTMKFGLIAAAIAFGLGAIGAGFAISHVGAAAMGAVAEKPQIAGQALIFVALAEGLVVFGFITALMILGKLPQ